MLGFATRLNRRPLACATFVVLATGCSSGLDNRQRSDVGTEPEPKLGLTETRFRNPEMVAKYNAAKASRRSFDPVYAYAKAVTDGGLALLVDASCESCVPGEVRYKRRSELPVHYWPIVEDALSMLEALGDVKGLTAEQIDSLVVTKGRLLWLAGRSMEEQTSIDEYAHAHPRSVAVVRRRLELLREAGDVEASESQCTRSRAKLESAPEAVRLDLLTACVALHPDNADGRSDLMDYAEYLPNLSTAEDALYRLNLAQRCVERVGDVEAGCAQACACLDQDAGKHAAATCKRACGGCRNEMSSRLRLCKKIAEPPRAPARAARSKNAPVKSVSPPQMLEPGA